MKNIFEKSQKEKPELSSFEIEEKKRKEKISDALNFLKEANDWNLSITKAGERYYSSLSASAKILDSKDYNYVDGSIKGTEKFSIENIREAKKTLDELFSRLDPDLKQE